MKSHLAKVSLALLSAAFLLGCQEQGSEPVGPEGPQFNKPGSVNQNDCPVALDKDHCHGDDGDPGTKVTWSVADLTADGVDARDASTLQSTCDGTPAGATLSNPTVEWKDGNEDEFEEEDDGENEHCVTVTPVRTDDLPTVTLGNDAHLIVATKKGGTIVTVQFLIQDKAGPEGIQYRTDRFSLDVTGFEGFTGAGFILHLHATDVPIYRLKGHMGGPKVENVGTINIGDIVYR